MQEANRETYQKLCKDKKLARYPLNHHPKLIYPLLLLGRNMKSILMAHSLAFKGGQLDYAIEVRTGRGVFRYVDTYDKVDAAITN